MNQISQPEIETIVRRVVASMLAHPDRDRSGLATIVSSSNPSVSRTPTVQIESKVIAVSNLSSIPAGTTRIMVSKQAILTPAARDWLRERKIEVDRLGDGMAKSSNTSKSDITNKRLHQIAIVGTNSTLVPFRRLAEGKSIQVLDSMAGQPVVDDSGSLRAISGLVRTANETEANSQGFLLLAKNPYHVVWQAGRDDRLRAAVVETWTASDELLKEVPLNLMVLPASKWTTAGLGNLARKWLRILGRGEA